MDDSTPPEPRLVRASSWLRPTPTEAVGLAVLLTGALAASLMLWWSATGRPSGLSNEASQVGEMVVDGHGPPDPPATGHEPAAGGADVPAAPDPAAAPATAPGPMTVHVTGAVTAPGVVVVPAGSRVGDAVEAAGGLDADAAPELINLARPLADGEHVHVPRPGDDPPDTGPPPGAVGAGGGEHTAGRVNINRAAQAELETLPGIGPAKASAIVEYREANGPFATPGDLRNVSGIGEATFQRLADLIDVG